MRKDLTNLSDNSKVWVYQADRNVTDEELAAIRKDIREFTERWSSHGLELDCFGDMLHHRFVVLVADDTQHVSGCSIDSSVHFIKELEKTYGLEFFNRLNYAYIKDGEFHFIHQKDFKEAYRKGELTDETLIVNNLVRTKKEYQDKWIAPLKDSWYKKMLT